MTTLQHIELQCPICEVPFCSPAVTSTDSFGGKHTDFHEIAMGTLQPLPFWIHTCYRCGFSGPQHDFTGEIEIEDLSMLKELVPEHLSAHAAGMSGSEKYEATATIAEWRGMPARYVAELLLRAAWCCVDEEDTEAERFYRRKAVLKYEGALASYDGIPRKNRAEITYLVGELWRRVGNIKEAESWFDRVAEEVTNIKDQGWVVDMARQQRDYPREWFQ